MSQRRRIGWHVCFLVAVILGAMSSMPVAYADGPVKIEVDKQQGSTMLEQPVLVPAPEQGPASLREVEQVEPEAKPRGWLSSLWNKVKTGTPKFLDGALKWATGSSWSEWTQPGGLSGAFKKMGTNLLNSALELTTGAGLEKWRDVKNWGWKDWLYVGAMTALTVVPIGKVVGAGLRVASKAAGGVAGRVAAKLAPKVGGGLLRRAGAWTLGRLNRTPWGRGLVKSVGEGAEKLARHAKARQVGAFLRSTAKKIRGWNQSVGLRGIRNYFRLDTRNPLMRRVIDRLPRVKAALTWPSRQLTGLPMVQRLSNTRIGRYLGGARTQVWHVRDTIVKRNPAGLILSGLENLAKAGITRNAQLMQKGATPLVRQIGYAKREFWRGMRDIAAMMRNREAARTFVRWGRAVKDQAQQIYTPKEGT